MPKLTDTSVPLAERLEAAKALATSTSKKAIDTLVGALGSTDQELTKAVLGSLKALDAAPVLEARLTDSDEPERTRVQAAIGLRHLKVERSVAALTRALGDPNANVRKEAALALTVVGAAKAEQALLKALGDDDGDVRYFAADALASVKTAGVKKGLEARLAHETNPTVQFALRGALLKQAR